MDDLIFASAVELARLIRTGVVSSVEVVSAHIDHIERINPHLNAIVQFRPDAALAEARALDAQRARGEIVGPLHGVPFTVKDYMAIPGLISTFGTLGLAQNVMQHECEIVARLRRAGGVALGLTNMPEFGVAIETDNLIYGRTNNPYDLDRFPGGSSGGESAIIAAGGSPLGVGGDSGGSIREPAHYCGIAGLKMTTGRIPRTGLLLAPSGALAFKSQNGPMARYVEDLALGMQILAGEDGRDPHVVPMPLLDPAQVDLKALRVAYYTDNGIVSCTPEIVTMVHRAAAAFTDLGVPTVVEAPPPNVSKSLDLYLRLSMAPGATAARAGLQALGTTQMSDFYTAMLPLLEQSDNLSAADFLNLTEEWDQFKADMLAYMRDYDIIVSPTTSIPAMPHRSSLTNQTIMQSFTYCSLYNLVGYPAATVRGGTSPENLPIGVQVAARPWREDLVLAAAAYLERTLGGYQKPSLSWLSHA